MARCPDCNKFVCTEVAAESVDATYDGPENLALDYEGRLVKT